MVKSCYEKAYTTLGDLGRSGNFSDLFIPGIQADQLCRFVGYLASIQAVVADSRIGNLFLQHAGAHLALAIFTQPDPKGFGKVTLVHHLHWLHGE